MCVRLFQVNSYYTADVCKDDRLLLSAYLLPPHHHCFLVRQVLDAIASPSIYPCQRVIHSFRFGDSYRISELCELVS